MSCSQYLVAKIKVVALIGIRPSCNVTDVFVGIITEDIHKVSGWIRQTATVDVPELLSNSLVNTDSLEEPLWFVWPAVTPSCHVERTCSV